MEQRQSQTNRVVVRTSVVHCVDGQNLRAWGKPRSYLVASRDSAFDRELDVGETWQPLNLGGVDDPSLVIVEHVAGAAVEVACEAVSFAEVLPGRDFQLKPIKPLSIRGVGGVVRVRVVVLPR